MNDVQNSTAGNDAAPNTDDWFEDDAPQAVAPADLGDPDAKPASDPEPAERPEPEQRAKTVPHQALHAERIRRQQVEAELQAQRQRWELADKRMAELAASLEAKNAPQPPDVNQDPLGYIKYLEAKQDTIASEMQAQKAERERQQQEYYQQQEQARVVNQIDNAYKAAWSEKLDANPDAGEAYNSFVRTLDAHFQIRGITDPAQRTAAIQAEERAIAYAAIQQGRDPAEAIISQAKVYGYVPKPANADETLQRRQDGLKAARSLSQVSGKAGGGMPTAAQLADMPIEEYEEFRAKLSPRQLAKLLGAP